MKKKNLNMLERYIKPFFFKNNKQTINPLRVFSCMFLFLSVIVVIMKISNVSYISDTFTLEMIGTTGLFTGLNVWSSNNG